MKTAKGKGASSREKKEALKPVDRKVTKRKAALKADKTTKRLAGKEKKDPRKPKRPPSAFFVFLEEFRKIFKEENPNVKAVSAVGKAGGLKWKSLSSEEKAPYEAKAVERKSEYDKLMAAYNKKQEGTDDEDEELVNSKSEVNGEDDDDDASEDEDDEDDD